LRNEAFVFGSLKGENLKGCRALWEAVP